MPAAPGMIRPFHPSDLPAIYRICLLTGEAGGDATALYRDPDLLGHLYAGPYPVADPGLTFVVVDELGPVGYIVATADTHRFEQWLERQWWPTLRTRYPVREDPHDGTEDHVLVGRIHEWAAADDSLFDRFPAHMHIDLLPRAQGLGPRAPAHRDPRRRRCASGACRGCTSGWTAATRAPSRSTRASASPRPRATTGAGR